MIEWLATRGTQIVLLAGTVAVVGYAAISIIRER